MKYKYPIGRIAKKIENNEYNWLTLRPFIPYWIGKNSKSNKKHTGIYGHLGSIFHTHTRRGISYTSVKKVLFGNLKNEKILKTNPSVHEIFKKGI